MHNEWETTVSIITPCYNSARFVGETVASVQAQTFQQWEQIVVDDGSGDGPETVVLPISDKDKRVLLVVKKNGGVASARNTGFHAAVKTSRYLVFLDADDCLEPTFLHDMVSYMDAHSGVGLGYCDAVFIDEQSRLMDVSPSSQGWNTQRCKPGRWGVQIVPEKEANTPFSAVFALTTIIPSLVILRRSVYEQTLGWDEDFGHIGEDTDVFLQIALRSEVHHIARPLVRYRRHGAQSTADKEKYYRQEKKLYEKWASMKNLTSEQKQIVQDAIKFREGKFAAYKGVSQGAQHLRNGQILPAVRFWGGAAKRWVRAVCAG